MRISRSRPSRRATIAVAVAVLAALAAGCSSSDASEKSGEDLQTVRYANGAGQTTMSNAVLLYGQAEGIFAKHGITLDTKFVTPAAAQAAITAGEADIAFDGDGLLRTIATSGRGEVIMTTGPLPCAIYARGNLDLAGLAGKTVASTVPGGTLSTALERALASVSLDGSKAKITYLQTEGAVVAALEHGTVDAAVLSSPATARAQLAGFHEVSDATSFTAPTVYATTKGFLKSDEKTVTAFVAAMAEATRAAVADPAGLQEAYLKANPDMKPDVAKLSLTGALPTFEVSAYPVDQAKRIMASSPGKSARDIDPTPVLNTEVVSSVGAVAPQGK